MSSICQQLQWFFSVTVNTISDAISLTEQLKASASWLIQCSVDWTVRSQFRFGFRRSLGKGHAGRLLLADMRQRHPDICDRVCSR